MKPFNSELNHDIEKLKLLHAKKDKTDFNSFKDELMLKYSVSKATIYREMKKLTPGTYKKPDYNPPNRPITQKEIRMVAELLLKGKDVQEIQKLMQRKTGDKYSWDRITQIREIVDLRLGRKAASPAVQDESVFGDKVQSFIETLFELDNIGPGAKVTVWVSGEQFTLRFSDIKDIALVIANSKGTDSKDAAAYMKRKVFHLLNRKIRMCGASGEHSVSFKDIAEINRMYRELERDELEGFSPDYKVLLSVVTALKPDASYSEILELAKKYHDEITGSSKYIIPYEMWLREQSDFRQYSEMLGGLCSMIEEGEAVITDAEKVFPYIKENFGEFMLAYEKLYEKHLGTERMEFLRERELQPDLHERVMKTINAKQRGQDEQLALIRANMTNEHS